MKNFADAAFEPELIEVMTAALDHAVASLPEPVSSAHVKQLAESILRTAKSGERSAAVLSVLPLSNCRSRRGIDAAASPGSRNRSTHAGVLPA